MSRVSSLLVCLCGYTILNSRLVKLEYFKVFHLDKKNFLWENTGVQEIGNKNGSESNNLYYNRNTVRNMHS